MSDLRPYLCPFEDCPGNKRMLGLPGSFIKHIQENHDLSSWVSQNPDCPLCGLHLSLEEYILHLGCHMEKIALLAIPDHNQTDEAFDFSAIHHTPGVSNGAIHQSPGVSNNRGSSDEDEDSISGWSSDSSC